MHRLSTHSCASDNQIISEYQLRVERSQRLIATHALMPISRILAIAFQTSPTGAFFTEFEMIQIISKALRQFRSALLGQKARAHSHKVYACNHQLSSNDFFVPFLFSQHLFTEYCVLAPWQNCKVFLKKSLAKVHGVFASLILFLEPYPVRNVKR